MEECSLAAIGRRLCAIQHVLIATHPRPDGDAVGSCYALAVGLRANGVTAEVYLPEGLERFAFLDDTSVSFGEPSREDYDATVLLDCSDERSLGRLGWARERFGVVFALDHHKTVHDYADVLYRDPDAAAAGLIVYRLFEALGWPLGENTATALYCAISSDTGFFRYQNTSGEALRTAARLVESGADPWRIASALYEKRSVGEVRLLARVLDSLEVRAGGALGLLFVDDQMLRETGCREEVSDGYVNFARGIDTVEVAALIRARAAGARVSLRSQGRVDVAALAEARGGGGHHNAAGFDWEGDLEALRRYLEAETSLALGEGDG